jgi:hypothetical protein
VAGAVPSEITIYAPGLLGPYVGQANWSADDWPRLPLLQKLLSRADRVAACPADESDYGNLFHYFGLTPTEPLPLAALCLLAEGRDPQQACWMRLDPVALHADTVDIVLLGHDELSLSEAEADKLLAALNTLLEEWSASLQRTTPHHWYVCLSRVESLSTTPVSRVKGLAITGHMPAGDDYLKWHRLMNEVQMLWHSHPVNEQRQQEGLLTANGVWPWGCGVLPEKSGAGFDAVYSDDLVTQGLAQLNDIPRYSLQKFEQLPTEGKSLIVDLSWRYLQQHNDASGWFEALRQWQGDVLVRLENILDKSPKTKLNFNFGPPHCYQLTHKTMRRWWRKTKSFPQLVLSAQHEG